MRAGKLFPLPRTSKDNRIVFGSLLPRKARMSILDDAIREHLELKRQHGADEAELKRLEDEAFGPPGRPEEESPFAEAPTEFLATEGPADDGGEEAGRRVNIADLQEPPPPDQRIREQGEGTPVVPAEDAAQVAPPAEEEPPAIEEPAAEEAAIEEPAVEEPAVEEIAIEEPDEHEAVAEQPTQLFDVEAEMASEEEPPAEVPSPSDEEIADAEAVEPKLAPVEPATEIYASRAEVAEPEVEEDEDEFDEFFSDQRLSEELDQALEAPLTDEHEIPAPPAAETAAPLTDERDEGDYEDEEDEDAEPESGHEDVLEDTPDFLEDAPEDDELWFEQRPPKDFDFDD
jgi:hypothetical protein